MELESIAELELAEDPAALAQAILEGTITDVEVAASRIAAIRRIEPRFDTQLLQRLKEYADDDDVIIRVLRVIGRLPDWQRLLSSLMQYMQSRSPRVRAQAAKLVAAGIRKPEWLEAYMRDPDARVRANLLEGASAWLEDRRVLLLAANDTNHRVACNALLRLRQIKAPSAAWRLQRLADHANPMFRRAAAWAMGMTKEPWFYPVLSRMRNDADPAVRLKALQGMKTIFEGCAFDPEQLRRLRDLREEIATEND